MKGASLLAGLLLLVAGQALAHSELQRADPAAESVLSAAPSTVALQFSEAVEVRFSTFKVYRLDETATGTTGEHDHDAMSEAHDRADHDGQDGSREASDHSADAHDHAATPAASDPEWLRLSGLAGALVSEVLDAKEDGPARVDLGTQETGESRTVTLALPEELEPGVYVVMWKVLSVDGHVSQGYYLFRVASAE